MLKMYLMTFTRVIQQQVAHICTASYNRRPPPVLDEGQVWWVATPLDAKVMHEAAQELVGHHDFTTFRGQ